MNSTDPTRPGNALGASRNSLEAGIERTERQHAIDAQRLSALSAAMSVPEMLNVAVRAEVQSAVNVLALRIARQVKP